MTTLLVLPSDFQPFECGAPFSHTGKPGELDGKKLKAEFHAAQGESV